MDPLVDIAVVTYGRSDLVARCLGSVMAYAERERLRVTVVDNCSPDDTPDVIAATFPAVRLIRRRDNPGFAVSTNQALALSTAPWVLVLNPDTELAWETLAHLVAELEAKPDVGVIGCRLVLSDGTFDHAAKRNIPSPTQALVYFASRVVGRKSGDYVAHRVDEHGTGDVDAVNGAFMLLRREALEEVGGLDEDFWMYGEDLDWCLRFKQAGWRVFYDGTVSATHIKGGSSDGRRSWKLNYQFHRSMALFYRKHFAAETNPFMRALVLSGIWLRCAAVQLRNSLPQRTERAAGDPS